MLNVLIIEDESIVALEISLLLKELGYNVVGTPTTAKKAYELVESHPIDVVLTDIHLKGNIDGIECMKNIQKKAHIPFLYLSALQDDEILQRAIATNPSAYLIKPFNIKELQAAVQIATQHIHVDNKIGDVAFDDAFSFDTYTHELFHKGSSVHLTKKEQALLSLLVAKKNTLLSIEEIENSIWPDKPANENTRRALVARLRSKLNYKFLETLHSIGYRLNI